MSIFSTLHVDSSSMQALRLALKVCITILVVLSKLEKSSKSRDMRTVANHTSIDQLGLQETIIAQVIKPEVGQKGHVRIIE